MKIIAVRAAKAIWLIPSYFLNPHGFYTWPAISALKERYKFLITPLDGKMPPDLGEGIKFGLGAFEGKNGLVQITSFSVHEDGIVAEMRSSTDDGDDFLQDALSWFHAEFKTPKPDDLLFKKIYTSELNIVLKQFPKLLNPALAEFFDAVSSTISTDDSGPAPVLSVQLGTDQTKLKNQTTFQIAREVNTPIADNRFYSFAPVKTSVHIQLLEKLEKIEA